MWNHRAQIFCDSNLVQYIYIKMLMAIYRRTHLHINLIKIDVEKSHEIGTEVTQVLQIW